MPVVQDCQGGISKFLPFVIWPPVWYTGENAGRGGEDRGQLGGHPGGVRRLSEMCPGGDAAQRGLWCGQSPGSHPFRGGGPRGAGGSAGGALCGPGGPLSGRHALPHPPGAQPGFLYHQHRQVPAAPEPGPPGAGAGRLHRLPPAADRPHAAQDHRVPGAHRRHAPHQTRLQDHTGARAVVYQERRGDDRPLPPLCPAAGPRQAAGDL